MHVGDLDASASIGSRGRWNAEVTITIHDESESPVSNADVRGAWSGGADAQCTTDSSGQCTVTYADISRGSKSVTFAVDNVEYTGFGYESADNHDPDGDSDGTSITIPRP
jgi:hypothetical protein